MTSNSPLQGQQNQIKWTSYGQVLIQHPIISLQKGPIFGCSHFSRRELNYQSLFIRPTIHLIGSNDIYCLYQLCFTCAEIHHAPPSCCHGNQHLAHYLRLAFSSWILTWNRNIIRGWWPFKHPFFDGTQQLSDTTLPRHAKPSNFYFSNNLFQEETAAQPRSHFSKSNFEDKINASYITKTSTFALPINHKIISLVVGGQEDSLAAQSVSTCSGQYHSLQKSVDLAGVTWWGDWPC